MEVSKSIVNAIALLLSLFTDEEKEALKITLGIREITLEEQFVARWHNAKPRYQGSLFLYKAAHIINGNRALFTRAIEFNKPEFQEKLKSILSDPDSYIKVKETKIDNTDKLKNISVSKGSSSGLSQAANKTRSGVSESGHEYVELDKLWEREDQQALNKRLASDSIGLKVDIDPTKKGIDQISLGLEAQQPVQDNSNPVNYFEAPTVDSDSENPELILHSLNISQARNQSLTQQNANKLGVNDQLKELDGKTTTKDLVTVEALQLMTATKIKDPRETAFQKLDVLFIQCQ